MTGEGPRDSPLDDEQDEPEAAVSEDDLRAASKPTMRFKRRDGTWEDIPMSESSGITLERGEEIQRLIQEGRESDVPEDELAQYQKYREEIATILSGWRTQFDTSKILGPLFGNSDAFRDARKTISRATTADWLKPAGFTVPRAPSSLVQPNYSSGLDSIAASMAKRRHEEEEREEEKRQTALAQLEALEKLAAASEEAARSQFAWNWWILVVAALTLIATVLGLFKWW